VRYNYGMPDTPLPYERQPGESTKAYAAFCIYRDLGPNRGLREACRQFYGEGRANLAQLDTWSSRWNWVSRAKAWDDELDRVNREAQAKARRDMAERHAKVGMALQDKAIRRLAAMQPDELSTADMTRYLIEGCKLEAVARGEPATIAEQRHTGQDGPPLSQQARTILQALVESVAVFPEARVRLAERLRQEAALLRNLSNGHETTPASPNGHAGQ
jgi:hypothetical protein